MVATDVSFNIQWDDDFKRQISAGMPTSSGTFNIEVGGIELKPDGDIEEYLILHFLRLCEIVPKVVKNEDGYIEYLGSRGVFIVSSTDDPDVVRVLCAPSYEEEPWNDTLPSQGIEVEKEALLRGIFDASDDLYDKLLEINSGLSDHDYVNSFKDALEEAKAASSSAV